MRESDIIMIFVQSKIAMEHAPLFVAKNLHGNRSFPEGIIIWAYDFPFQGDTRLPLWPGGFGKYLATSHDLGPKR